MDSWFSLGLLSKRPVSALPEAGGEMKARRSQGRCVQVQRCSAERRLRPE